MEPLAHLTPDGRSRRILITSDCPQPCPIVCGLTGLILGDFVSGLGYWMTPQNSEQIRGMLSYGHAVEIDPSTAPLGAGPVELDAVSSTASGAITVDDVDKAE